MVVVVVAMVVAGTLAISPYLFNYTLFVILVLESLLTITDV